MADPLFDQVSATTLAEMQRDVVYDEFCVRGSWQRIMRYYSAQDPFPGGLYTKIPFIYDRTNGGAATPGADRQVTEKTLVSAMGFTPRAYVQDIPMNLWTTEVVNAGPQKMVDLHDIYYEVAVNSMNTDLNLDAYCHGQAAGTGVAQDRTIFMNGIDEALSNGVDPGWMGNYYTTYGGHTRNGVVTSTLNSGVTWAGDQNGNTGMANWDVVVGAYMNCRQTPDTMLSNKALFTYLWSREETKQRFAQEADARIGLTGFHVFDAYYHVDKLCPSTKFGTLIPSGTSQTTSIKPSTFTTPATVSTISGYPASTLCNPGEPMFILRLKDWKLRPSSSPEYNHFFTPALRSDTNPERVTVFYKLALEHYTPSPQDNWQIVGFGF